jgi:hypothetical protein
LSSIYNRMSEPWFFAYNKQKSELQSFLDILLIYRIFFIFEAVFT